MKIFISYKFTGETNEDLKNLLLPVKNALKKMEGVESVYCNFFDEDLPIRSKNFKSHEYVTDAFPSIDKADAQFVIINSEEKSEGMILEMGYAIAKGKKVIVAIKNGITNTYLPGIADESIEWESIDDLTQKIYNLKL